MTTLLDRVAPMPALVEIDAVDLAVEPARAWQELRHADLGTSPLIRALFAVRTIPDRLRGHAAGPPTLRIDDLRSSMSHPGFQILAEDAGHEVVVGAIGKVWHLEIPFVHVDGGDAFRAFSEPGFVKVAWAIRVEPLGEQDSRVTIEVRVDATDMPSWTKFQRYFTLIGPGSRFIRSTLLASLAKRFGTPDETRALPGDELLEDAAAQMTRAVMIAAPPEKVWPWLVEAGAELPETPATSNGFEVLVAEPNRALVLGALYDADAKRQREFRSPRSEHYWHVTWSFFLEPRGAGHTRLHVRARAAFPPNGRVHTEWIRPVHGLMHQAQLRQLVARIEGRQPRDSLRDLASGAAGASIMVAALLTPFLREERHRDRELSAAGLAVDRAARRRSRRLLQLPGAREGGRLQRSKRRRAPPRMDAHEGRRAAAPSEDAAAPCRRAGGREVLRRARSGRRRGARRGKSLGKRELALLARAARRAAPKSS